MPNVVRIEDLGQYVVAETLRQIRNGQVRLKRDHCIDTEPRLKVQFQVNVAIPGGVNAITRSNSSTSEQTTEAGEQITTDEGKTVQVNQDKSVETPELKDTSEQTTKETQSSTDVSTKTFGRSNVVAIEHEE